MLFLCRFFYGGVCVGNGHFLHFEVCTCDSRLKMLGIFDMEVFAALVHVIGVIVPGKFHIFGQLNVSVWGLEEGLL
jgi:hypothetical protein